MNPSRGKNRVCLVVDEPKVGSDGKLVLPELAGILDLLTDRHRVDVIVMTSAGTASTIRQAAALQYSRPNVRVEFLDPVRYASFGKGQKYRPKSYAVFRHLTNAPEYHIVHFIGESWLAFYTLAARSQGVAFANTMIVLQPRGVLQWQDESRDNLPGAANDLIRDFMERGAVARTDYLVCASQHELDWLRKKGWELPPAERCMVIPPGPAPAVDGAVRGPDPVRDIDELIFLMPAQVGAQIACDALDRLAPRLAAGGIKVTLLGAFQSEAGFHSGIDLIERARNWTFPIAIVPHDDPQAIRACIGAAGHAVTVMPERLPLDAGAAVHPILMGCPVIVSDEGGAREAIAAAMRDRLTCRMTGASLAACLSAALEDGLPRPVPELTGNAPHQRWRQLYRDATGRHGAPWRPGADAPRVTVCITHYQRLRKLKDAIHSILRQSYANIEIIVVDDGSPDPQVQAGLERMQPFFQQNGIRLIRRENGYLGAARNPGAAAASGEYICFLDDDDIALPDMVEKLVTAARNRGAEIVSGLQISMPNSRRTEVWPLPEAFRNPVSFFPIGGPLTLTLTDYSLSNATALVSMRAFRALGGYSELRNVGGEDHEFFTRALQAGIGIEICPFTVYLYEDGILSMVSTTSSTQNMARVLNSIDLDGDAGKWQDLFRLIAGQRAHELVKTKYKWRLAKNAHQETLLSLLEAAKLSAQLEHLALYASMIDAMNIADALTLALQSLMTDHAIRHTRGTLQDDALHPLDEAPPPGAESDAPHGDLIGRIRRYRGQDGDERDGLISDIRLAMAQGISVDGYRWLLRAAEESLLARDVSALVDETLFMLALRAGNWDLALRRASAVLRQEEDDYLTQYQDVANAVKADMFKSGLRHYILWGQREARTGFLRLMKMVDVVRHWMGHAVPMDELIQYLTAVQAGHIRRRSGGTDPAGQ